jgi:hypothetical protein
MTVDAGAVLFGAWPGQRGIEWIASHPLETLQSVLGLGFVIFVHELGHFLVAKACGVKCEKFYLGFDVGGLKLCSFKWGETEYGIGALPLGGYVKMLGQDDNPGAATAEAWSTRDPEAALANATPYLQAFGHTVLAWIWLDVAVAAARVEGDLARGKLQAARYFFRYELPRVDAWLAVVSTRDDTCRAMNDGWW